MPGILPHIDSQETYRQIKGDRAKCLEAVTAICRRNHISVRPGAMFANGYTIVYPLGETLVLKLYSPLYPDDLRTERLALSHVHGRLTIPTPGVRFSGDLDGWPYLIMDRLPGTPLAEVWGQVAEPERRRLCRQIGEAMRSLHELPIDGLEPLTRDWNRFMAERVENAAAHHREKKTPAHWCDRILAFLPTIPWETSPVRQPALLHTEIMRDHVLVTRTKQGWSPSGLIDFEPAMVGHPEYDLASIALFVAGGERGLLREVLLGYGYGEQDLTPALRKRIMGYILLHLQSNLPWYLQFMPQTAEGATMETLAEAWISFDSLGTT